MSEHFIGIDPGVHGAIAVLNAGGDLLQVCDMPALGDGPAGRRNVNAPLLAEFVEYVGARPKKALWAPLLSDGAKVSSKA
jgi:hypothetical protein